jgi:dienelactone hydrolase
MSSWMMHVHPLDALADTLPFVMPDTSSRPVGFLSSQVKGTFSFIWIPLIPCESPRLVSGMDLTGQTTRQGNTMADVVVYHHAQGLTDGVRAFADQLRVAGHEVTTPDLFGGKTFASIDEGVAYAQEVGFDTVLERGMRAADDLPSDLYYVGFSLGVMPAQALAQTRPGARGAVLCYACVPASEFGAPWPDGVPVQIHGMDADPFFAEEDLPFARELVQTAKDAELFLYPGDQHLFADSSVAGYDAAAAALLTDRVLAFLR